MDVFLQFLLAKAPLAAVLAVMVTCIAYISNPRVKMFVFCIPIPFTCAYLATGLPINATHMTGLMMSVAYHWVVYLLRVRCRLPLGVAIATGVVVYLGSARLLTPAERLPLLTVLIPSVIFWMCVPLLYRHRDEPAYRSRSPWWLKAPVIFAIALVIFSLTSLLKGAVTTFPYAGVFVSYEMRNSLRTLAGQYATNVMAFLLMLTAMWSAEQMLPAPWRMTAILIGLPVALTFLSLIHRRDFGRPPTIVVPG